MVTREYNKGVSFEVPTFSYPALCRLLEKVPGVVFTKRRKFFWSVFDIAAEFTFRGHCFTITTDEWDGTLWLMTKDHKRHTEEMQALRNAVETAAAGSNWGARLRRLLRKEI